jgi:hypothetical protein
MCQFKSFIVLKDSIFEKEGINSHSDLLDLLDIKDTRENAETKFVRVELLPQFPFDDIDN